MQMFLFYFIYIYWLMIFCFLKNIFKLPLWSALGFVYPLKQIFFFWKSLSIKSIQPLSLSQLEVVEQQLSQAESFSSPLLSSPVRSQRLLHFSSSCLLGFLFPLSRPLISFFSVCESFFFLNKIPYLACVVISNRILEKKNQRN